MLPKGAALVIEHAVPGKSHGCHEDGIQVFLPRPVPAEARNSHYIHDAVRFRVFLMDILAAGFNNRDFLAVAQDAAMWPDGRFLALRLSADAVLLQTLLLPASGSVFP